KRCPSTAASIRLRYSKACFAVVTGGTRFGITMARAKHAAVKLTTDFRMSPSRKWTCQSSGRRMVSVFTSGSCRSKSIHQFDAAHEIVEVHRLFRVVRAVLIAHEDHTRRNPAIGEDRGIMPRPARKKLRRKTKLLRAFLETVDDGVVHLCRFGVYPLVEFERDAALLGYRTAFRMK